MGKNHIIVSVPFPHGLIVRPVRPTTEEQLFVIRVETFFSLYFSIHLINVAHQNCDKF